MRKKIRASLKTKVAIEAIKGFKTISEIASEYSIHPNQVSQWKKQFLDNADQLFTTPKKAEQEADHEAQTDKLYAKIGRLEMEVDFLKKKSKELGL